MCSSDLWTQSRLCIVRNDRSPILVAWYGSRRQLVHLNMSTVSDSTDSQRPYSPDRRDTRSVIREDIHQHNAPTSVGIVQVHCSGLFFAHVLSRVSHAMIRDSENDRKLDF